MNKVVFWHTYLVGDYKLVVQEQITKLITSGLYNEVDYIFTGISAFSGTYWWSKSNYIKTLDEKYLYDTQLLGNANPLTVEFFIGSNHNGNLTSIFECKDEAPYRVECLINEYIKV